MAASSASEMLQTGGSCNGTAADLPNIEQEFYDYEMHMKMCKKIAQLTKVIYSLNTKCDEHESTLQALRDTHQEEIQCILEETRGKILQYKIRVGEEMDLRQRLQAMEEALEQQKQRKEEALNDFDAYRRQTEERELTTETEHAEHVMSLSKEMLDMKKDFENKLQSFSKLRKQLEQDKEKAVAELERASQESTSLQDECRVLRRSSVDERGRMEEMCNSKTQALWKEVEELRAEKLKLTDEFNQNICSLKAAHEEEQEALKRSLQQSVSDTLKQWQQRELEQRKALQAALQQKLKRTEGELEVKGQRLNDCKRHSVKLQESIQELETQLQEAYCKISEAVANMRKSENELIVAKERLILQENEILTKSEELMSHCSSQNKTSAELEELRSQVLQFQNRIRELEQKSNGKNNKHAQQVKQHVEALTAYKQDLQQTHKEKLWKWNRQPDEKTRLKEQLMKALEEVMRKHAVELKSVQTSLEIERRKTQKDLQTRVEESKKRVRNERKQLEKVKDVLSSKLQESISEVSILESLMQQSENSCEQSAQSSKSSEMLSKELDETHLAISELKEELEQQKEKHQKEISALEMENQKNRDQILGQVEAKYKEKTRLECDRLCERLKKEHAEKQLSALNRMQKEKETEIQKINEEWRKEIEALQSQHGEQKLESNQLLSQDALQKLEAQFTKEKEKLKQELQESTELKRNLKSQLDAANQQILKKDENSINQELKEAEERLQKQHEEKLQEEQQSHRLAQQPLEEKAGKGILAERQCVEKQQSCLLETPKVELTQQHAGWCQQVAGRHMKQIEDLQTELSTLRELNLQQQEGRQQNELQALRSQLEEYQSDVCSLRNENTHLKEQLASLSSEVEFRKQEVFQLQNTEEQQRRSTEDDLVTRHHIELESLKQEQKKEIQTIVSDFSSAQARLQARIVSLETGLKESEEKSKRQESRLEDLHVIGKLQEKVSARDHIIKRLVEERRCQQSPQTPSDNVIMRGYENQPQPGSLTPTLKKKKTEETPPRVISVPNLRFYEKSFLGSEPNPVKRSPQAIQSPSSDHGRSVCRPFNPSAHVPELKPIRSPVEEKRQDQRVERQDPQRQEWFTKYFSF
ncbi:protein FAM184B-like isoform X2 [Polyodon spathula]|uniref:protein FAM184B-like isoform X2 n=1 Tax=Polyodon spathula TaxID=7913 RepID=UPI001B7F58A2|nr:protein FAM184B-like isoform X2 [Polyodon spathula]